MTRGAPETYVSCWNPLRDTNVVALGTKDLAALANMMKQPFWSKIGGEVNQFFYKSNFKGQTRKMEEIWYEKKLNKQAKILQKNAKFTQVKICEVFYLNLKVQNCKYW